MLNADALPMLLRVARTNLFPNNSLAPPRATPDAEQALQIRQQAAEAVIDALPSGPVKVYLATADRAEAVSQVEKWLDTLGDQYLNKHLVIRIVELVVVRLVPEMGQRGVSELLEERLGNL